MIQHKTILIALVIILFAACNTSKSIETGSNPIAEYQKACTILMHEPGQELFDGIIHPKAALYERYFDINAASKEHQNYQKMLQNNGINVLIIKDILMDISIDSLQLLAQKSLIYSYHFDIDSCEIQNYRNTLFQSFSKSDLIQILLERPTIHLYKDSINTGIVATYEHNPLMNMYFMRDQSISTPCGQIMCKMNSKQRTNEVDIVELCYQHLGNPPVYRIAGENSFLEGGDYIPFGTMGLIGQGLRTSQGAIDEMLSANVIGHDTLVIVRDHWRNQYQMHLDTYFNVIDKDLVTLCFNRFDAPDSTDINFLTINMYARANGEINYHEVEEYAGMSFKQFLTNRGIQIIRISQKDADHYANNYLTINARHIMSVAGQSKELQETYKQYGVTVEWVPLNNLIGGYGAAHCMTQVIRRH